MKIAIFTETFLPMTDGIVTRLTATIRHLLEFGEKVMVFAPGKGNDYYLNAPIIRVPGVPLAVYPEKQITFPHPIISKALKEFEPEIIHAVNPVNLGAFGVFYAHRLHLPLISSYHTNTVDYMDYYKLGFFKPLAHKFIRWLHNQSQLNLCTSHKMMQELEHQGIKNVHLWDKGVDTEKFSPSYRSGEMRHRLSGGYPERTVILYVGRLGHEKGLEKLRPALDALPESCLALVGDGPARIHLEKIFYGTNTQFLGFLYGKELAQAYASADIFVLPSTTETLGLVLLEAMASGLPAIAVDNGPPAEIVSHEVSGLLFSPFDGQSLSHAITRLANDYKLRRKLACGALNSVRRKFNWRKPTQQLIEYYRQAEKILNNTC